MRFNYVIRALSLILKDFGLVVFIPVLVAVYYQEFSMILPFAGAGFFSLFLSLILHRGFKLSDVEDSLNDIKRPEALMVVLISWIMISVIAAMPYMFSGMSFINSLFESVSGITTTGATILDNYDIGKTLLFWRSFTQWIGGMGIIVLFVAILPQFAVAGRQMFFAEAPGPTEDKITPRIKHTASVLWIIYAGFTLLCILLLWFAGMPLFDSVCNAFSTLAAGGFSPNPNSIAGYNSQIITWIIIIFMFIAGTSFVLLSKVLAKRKLSLMWRNEEFRFYTIAILAISLGIAVILFVQQGYSAYHSITAALYQTITLATSTGSASEDYRLWVFDAKILLFIAMFLSSCAGSAGGGVKITRIIIIFKYLKNELYKILHPKAVLSIKIDGRVIPTDVIRQTLFFVMCYIAIWAVSSMFLAIIEQDVSLALVSSISALGDIGPDIGYKIGPMGSFSSLHWISKAILIFEMLIGRLEIIPFIVMFHKDFWNFKK